MAARKPRTRSNPPAPDPYDPPAEAAYRPYTTFSTAETRKGCGTVDAANFWAVPGGSGERFPRGNTGWSSSPFGLQAADEDDSIATRNRRLDACEYYYENCPPVKSAIDMFVDFVCSGVDIYHPNATKQDVHRHWWNMVEGRAVSERIVAAFFRHAFAPIRVYQADLRPSDVQDLGAGEVEEGSLPVTPRPSKRRIPVRYKLLPPKSVERVGGRGSLFSGVEKYGVRVHEAVNASSFADPGSAAVYENLDQVTKDKLARGMELLELPADQLEVVHYRKDDWRQFGNPAITCILKDLVLYDTMKAADKAALEGSISRVRLWTLGSMEYKIKPQPEDLTLLNQQILKVRNGASLDLIWDDSLRVQETSSDAASFLGSEKYQPVLQAIYAGLGIPQSLTGSSQSDGMTNNAMALKTLVGRLRTARALLINFWKRQFAVLQKAFGNRNPAELRFDDMWTSDEATMLKLYLDMHDRGLLSTATTLERFGELPEVEKARHDSEVKDREGGTLMPRQGPFNENASHPDQLLKLYANKDVLTPSEAGVRLKEKKDGEKTPMQLKTEQAVKVAKSKPAPAPAPAGGANPKGVAGQGRPKGAKDSGGRKQRTPKVRKVAADFVGLQIKAREDLKAIEASLQPAYLAEVGKKNLRQLTAAESDAFELRKFAALMGTPADAAFSGEPPLLQSPDPQGLEVLNGLQAAYAERGIHPNAGDVRELYATAYALFHQTGDDDGQAPARD